MRREWAQRGWLSTADRPVRVKELGLTEDFGRRRWEDRPAQVWF